MPDAETEIPNSLMVTKIEFAADWLTRYTGMPLDRFGNFVLLTNFRDYVQRFAARFACDIYGDNRPMQASTNDAGLTIINFGIGSPNAATVMDLLTAYHPEAVLFLGKCGGLKHATEIGHFIPPIAIRGEGTSTIIFHRSCPHCRRSSCINSCRRNWSNGGSITGRGLSTPPIAGCGSTTSNSASSSQQ